MSTRIYVCTVCRLGISFWPTVPSGDRFRGCYCSGREPLLYICDSRHFRVADSGVVISPRHFRVADSGAVLLAVPSGDRRAIYMFVCAYLLNDIQCWLFMPLCSFEYSLSQWWLNVLVDTFLQVKLWPMRLGRPREAFVVDDLQWRLVPGEAPWYRCIFPFCFVMIPLGRTFG